MRGLSGPDRAIGQDQFDVSRGAKEPPVVDQGRDAGRAGAGGGDRNRRQDRVARGEAGRDMFGRTSQEAREEDDNWQLYRDSAAGRAERVEELEAPRKKAFGAPPKGRDTW